MKATKKIVGAACALVAAVALSAGTTFAWFAANGTVTATGLKVSAVSDSEYLVISNTSGTKGSASGLTTVMGSSVSLYPVAHLDLSSSTSSAFSPTSSGIWYTDVSDKESDAETNSTLPSSNLTLAAHTVTATENGSTVTYNTLATGTGATQKDYVLKQTFYLNWLYDKAGSSASSGSSELSTSKTLYCSYKATTATYGEAVDVIFAVSKVGNSGTYYCGNVAASNTAADSSRGRTYSLGSVTISSYTALAVDVYIYINGEDENVKTANVSSLANLDLTVAFSTESETAAKKASGETTT